MAKQFGQTIAWVEENISASEFLEWIAFEDLYTREDPTNIQLGQIAYILAQQNSKKRLKHKQFVYPYTKQDQSIDEFFRSLPRKKEAKG